MTQTIPKTATDTTALRRPALFYGSAREGMRDFLERTLTSSDDGVLLPGFIGLSAREGSGVLDPVVEVGARVGFYDLNADLTVDLDQFARALSEDRYRVVVVIHYFGRSEAKMADIRALTDAHGALLVEDLAHGFFTAQVTGGAGRAGHLNLFSLHKMFPFEDGGMVQYATSDLLAGQASTRPELAQRLLDYDWQSIADVRRENFKQLTDLLSRIPEHGTEFSLLWPTLRECDVPQTLPVRIEGVGRDDIYFGMNDDGYGMVSLYHTLIEQSRDRFPNLTDVSRHIINFPVHQDSSPLEFAGMVASFRRHLESSRSTLQTGGSA
ncbi:DegT/DnrJ/EryC1/StrS family aminotransferase [Leifsonia sp. AG29]|uniref:DegT/DnrJ/EryC1/StrS family aminotransferase n=1 Tax=Leifsonia sp. AG29 TaxID=2598860 RepID=UPI00131B4899|nr:DegT/DnrJ/EryC1/StrS family aminotransferase [Leifsonia sp. AG29]